MPKGIQRSGAGRNRKDDASSSFRGARDQYSEQETEDRFQAILVGAMHKPVLHRDIPKKARRGAS
jgi:hypothetical protein